MPEAQIASMKTDSPDAPTGRDRRKELIERDMMDKACTLFAEKGYGGTSLTDIADAMGLTRAAVYYYFKNKEALLEAIVTEVTQAPLREIAVWRDQPAESSTERLRSFVKMRVRGVLSRQVQMRMIEVTETALPPDLLARHTEAKRRILDEYRGIIRQGIKSGEFRPMDDRIAAFAVIGIVNWTAYWYAEGRTYDESAVADQLAELAVHAVAVEKSSQDRFASPQAALDSLREDVEHLAKFL